MAEFSNQTLRSKLSNVFEDLFLDNKEVLLVVHDFLSAKTPKNLHKKPIRKETNVLKNRVAASPQVLTNNNDVSLPVATEDNPSIIFQVVTPQKKQTTDDDDQTPFSLFENDSLVEDGGPPPTVNGQSIIGLFPGDNAVSRNPNTLFSNGDWVDLEHCLHSYVETAQEKQLLDKIFSGQKYAPSDALIVASVNCFSRKKKRHFFRDGLYLCTVFAKEMSMRLSSFLQVRGWLVKNTKGSICISYRRIGDCLRLLGNEGAANYFRVSAMFDHLFRVLNSRDIWPEMPYEKSKSTSVGVSRT